MISGIYKISSLCKPDRYYIGSSKDIHKRWECHLRELKKHKHHSTKLQRHFDKYGKNDLVFSILIGCDKEELISTEQYFIDVYKPYFNGRLKAFNNGGYKQSDAEKERKREAMLGENNPNFGRKFSEQHIKRLSEVMKGRVSPQKGKKMSDETKQKLSEIKKGKPNPHKGYPVSEETRRIKSEQMKSRIPWNKGIAMREESKIKLSNSIKGKPKTNYRPHFNSEETKKKMSEARTKYYAMKKLFDVELFNN